MLPFVLLLFIVMPIVEIAVLLNVGAVIGWIPTILIVILTAVIGTWMLRQQGLATMMSARARMQSGEMPAQEILEGMLLLVGGALLLTPGFVTDAVGFACLIPPSRKLIARYLSRRAQGGFVQFHTQGPQGPGSAANRPFNTAGQRPRPSTQAQEKGTGNGNVIEGEYQRQDD